MARTSKMAAARAEALSRPITFEYDGESYTIAPAAEWPLEVLDEFEDGRLTSCVRVLLGDDQWSRFRSKPRTLGDLNNLFDAAQRAAGFSEGN